MAEVIVVVIMLGILAGIAVPVYSGIRRSSLENAAMHHARLVNAARDSFALTVPSAASQWTAAESDEAKLQLLIAQNFLAGSPSDYLAMSGDYSVQLTGALRARTVLLQNGHAIDY